MNHRIRPQALLVVLLLLATATPADARQDVVKDQFEVQAGGTLYLDIDYGDVEVVTHPDAGVLITMERNVDGASERELKQILLRQEYRFDRKGNDVVVEVRFDGDDVDRAWKRWKRDYNLEVDLLISVPEDYNVEFKTGAGNVEIAGLEGNVGGRTGAGNLDLNGITGLIDVSSGAGNIDIRDVAGTITVQSGAGTIDLEEIDGRIEARTGAGNISAVLVGPLAGNSSFDTGAGNVVVYLDVDTEADIEGKASLGNAKTDFDLRTRGKFMSKSFSGRINGGGPVISMSSGVGNVSLRKN